MNYYDTRLKMSLIRDAADQLNFPDQHGIFFGDELLGYNVKEFGGSYTAYFGGRRGSFKTGTGDVKKARAAIHNHLNHIIHSGKQK